ncbi:MAG: ribokinase [Infirmifilum sp.]
MQVCVVGSTHIDFFIRVPRIPRPGETIRGSGFFIKPGGKGANQAVGLGRLGAQVYMVGRIGKDYKDLLLRNFKENNVLVDYVQIDEEVNTGVAFILLSEEGENMIVFDPGADLRITPSDVERAGEVISRSKVLLTQLEIPLEAVERALNMAKSHGATTILNPAPAAPLPASLLRQVDILTPNRVEASMLSGVEVMDIKSALQAGRTLLEMGVGAVVMTLGSDGALLVTRKEALLVPAVRVRVVDTTGAGDAFNAGLAFGVAKGYTLVEATRIGSIAAALKVGKMGAQEGLPWIGELEGAISKFYEQTTPQRIK